MCRFDRLRIISQGYSYIFTPAVVLIQLICTAYGTHKYRPDATEDASEKRKRTQQWFSFGMERLYAYHWLRFFIFLVVLSLSMFISFMFWSVLIGDDASAVLMNIYVALVLLWWSSSGALFKICTPVLKRLEQYDRDMIVLLVSTVKV